MEFRLYEIAQVVGAKNDVEAYPDYHLSHIEFDSRKIGQSGLFLPLKGERDGHDFIPAAFDQGCLATFSEKEVPYPHILVEDCLTAFQTLARYAIEKTGVEVIAVTGSNGKTTTKDMIQAVLETTYSTYKTQGNYNNEIGLPYTVLHMPAGTEKLVLEMGQDHLGDIHLLSLIARPSLSVITLFGEAHLAFFGSRKQIAQGKMQIVDGMAAGSCLLLPVDPIADDFLPQDLNLVRFGEGGQLALTSLIEEKSSLRFTVNWMDGEIYLPVTGKYNATNAMVAAYVGKKLGVAEADIKQALAQLTLTANRTQWKKAENGADILSDVYNANPTAMRLILETFASIPKNEGGRKLLVLADMKELGDESVALHNQLVESLKAEDFDGFVFYGQDIEDLARLTQEALPEKSVFFFKKDQNQDQFDSLVEQVQTLLKPRDQILFKGSNSMNLAKIVAILEGEEGA